MIHYPLRGSYSPAQLTMNGSFQLNGASAPTVLRDGTKVSSSQKMFTVTRTSQGLYTVTFISGFPLPGLPFLFATIEQGATPTAAAYAYIVKGSWNTATRSFQIQLKTVAAAANTDADAGDRVTFEIKGAIESVGVDPA